MRYETSVSGCGCLFWKISIGSLTTAWEGRSLLAVCAGSAPVSDAVHSRSVTTAIHVTSAQYNCPQPVEDQANSMRCSP